MATFELTAHAAAVMRERGIEPAWIERALATPSRTEDDRLDPALRHALCTIAEREHRVLRVVYDPRARPWRVITAFFDRRERRIE